MRRRTIVLLTIPLLLGVLLLLARVAAAPLLHPALGFAAKVACSGILVGGMTEEQVVTSFPDERLRSVVRVRVRAERDMVRAYVPLLARRDAVHREGLGCTLVPVRSDIAAVQPPPSATHAPDAALPWPDGEAVAAPSPHIDTARLQAAVDSAFMEEAGRPARRTHAILVVHGGRLIAERYADGFGPDTRFPGWSMAKSVTSALAGVLAGRGLLDLDAAALRPEWNEPGDARAGITLGHLMHMTSGLDFDESYTPQGGATRMLFNSRDAVAAAAETPLRAAPGGEWYYASGSTNIVSGHLRRLTGGAYHQLPAELFAALGMTSAVMEPDAAGNWVGSSFLYATARDWARFGQLYLQDGEWNGQRLLPEGWVAYSVTPAPGSRGRYGAQWWLNAGPAEGPDRRVFPDVPPDAYWAGGFQGQHVAVVPSHDLVVVRLGVTEQEGAWSLRAFLRGVLDAVPPAPGDQD